MSISNKHTSDDRHTTHRKIYTHRRTVLSTSKKKVIICLKAFSVDDRWTRFVIFLFRDPHLLKCRQRCQDRTTNPHRVFALWRSDDLDLHRRWRQRSDLLLHTISNAWIHRRTYTTSNPMHHIIIIIIAITHLQTEPCSRTDPYGCRCRTS